MDADSSVSADLVLSLCPHRALARRRPVISFRFVSTSLTFPAWSDGQLGFISVLGYITKRGLNSAAFARSPGSLFDPRGIPARAGHGPDASPRDTLTRATLPAAPPQALRATTQTAGRFSSRTVSLSKQLLTLGLERGMYRGLGCASAWRSRHRPPLRHTGLTALPWPLSRPAPSARAPAAPSVSRPIFRVPCRVCIPLSTFSILLFCFQRVACLPNRLASSRRG